MNCKTCGTWIEKGRQCPYCYSYNYRNIGELLGISAVWILVANYVVIMGGVLFLWGWLLDRAGVSLAWIIVILFPVFFIYPIPAFIAVLRDKNTVKIMALNLCLGWTIIGWVVAFAWALRSE